MLRPAGRQPWIPCWTALLRGEIKIEPESTPNILGGGYANLFTNYAKGQFLPYAAVLQRGFFKMEKGVLVRKKVARQMLKIKAMSEEQMDKLLKTHRTIARLSGDKYQHRENPDHPWWQTCDSAARASCADFRECEPTDRSLSAPVDCGATDRSHAKV